MARIVKNDKNFKVIAITSVEDIEKCHFGTICDHCLEHYLKNKSPFHNVYYVAVLNLLFCTKCYINWIEIAEHYEEDIPYENKNFEFYCKILGLKEE